MNKGERTLSKKKKKIMIFLFILIILIHFIFYNLEWSQVFVMQPFELIKVRLQTQSKQAPQYSGILDCLGKIIKNEGPLALYKGI